MTPIMLGVILLVAGANTLAFGMAYCPAERATMGRDAAWWLVLMVVGAVEEMIGVGVLVGAALMSLA